MSAVVFPSRLTAFGSARFETVMNVALELPDVFVTRMFSKAYGMAGMRMGYAIGQPETLRKLSGAWGLGDTNQLQAIAGIAALADQEHMAWEKQENKRIRDYTTGEFQKMGFQVARPHGRHGEGRAGVQEGAREGVERIAGEVLGALNLIQRRASRHR